MDLNTISIKAISQRVLSDLKSTLGDQKYFLGASPLKALAYAISGISYMLHSHIKNVADYQLMPDTACGEYLKRWAKIFDLTLRPDENDDELRERVMNRIKHPSRGGTIEDYKAWVKNCSSVSAGQVFVFPATPMPGAVSVTFMSKNVENPFPKPEEVDLVRKDLNNRIPIGTTLVVYPLKGKPIPFTIAVEKAQDQDTVTNSIKRLLFTEATPGATLSPSKLNYVLSNALKGNSFRIDSPTQPITFDQGEIGVIDQNIVFSSWRVANEII